MISVALLMVAAAVGQTTAQAPGPDDIVVVARPDKRCEVRLAEKVLGDEDFHARARLWAAGAPARVFLSSGSNLQCRLKIVRKLEDWGVRLVEFIEPDGPPEEVALPKPEDAPAQSRVIQSPTDRPDPDSVEMSALRLRLIAGRAAHMIARGDCAGALKLELEAGDLDSAAKVVQICRSK